MVNGRNLFDDKPDRCPVCGTDARTEPDGDRPQCPRCGHLLWFISRRVGRVTVIPLTATRAAVLELLDLLENAVDEVHGGRVVIDFGLIQQVSSAVLGKLVKLRLHAEAVRGKLKLCGIHPDLRQVFRITRLDTVFELYDTEPEALASFGEPAG